jgi:hypothetical protein
MANNILIVTDYYTNSNNLSLINPNFTVNNIMNPLISGNSG